MTQQILDIGYRPTIPAALQRAMREFADRVFIVTPTEEMTYAQADSASRRVAKQLLAEGIGKGTHVALMDTFTTNWVIALLAITRIGALAMPLPSTYRAAELRRGLVHGDADALVLPRAILGRESVELVQAAIPEIDASGTPLFLDQLPYLRHVYLSGPANKPWAAPLPLGVTADRSAGGPASDRLLEAAEAAVTPSDPMVCIFTSGATTEPKAVVHTHGAQVRHGWNLARNFGAGISPTERVFCALPFFWIGGLTYQLMGALSVGSAVLCVERFTPSDALDLMERAHATRMVGWNSQIGAVREDPSFPARNLSTMPMFAPRSGPAADPELRHTSLGMTETGGPHTACPPEEAGRILPEEMRGSFGRSLPGIEHRIIDPETGAILGDGEPGEICVRGYNMMAGIYKQEQADTFDEEGWYRTGDLGTFREGYLYYFGRRTEMIKSAGANVSPREVEAALEALPGVQAAAVVGLPDSQRGQIVAAAIVPSPGSAVSVADVARRIADQVSSYKVPRFIVVLDADELPMLPTGKPNKQALALLLQHRQIDGLRQARPRS